MSYQDFIKIVLEESAKIADEKFGKVSGTIKDGDSNQVLTQADIEESGGLYTDFFGKPMDYAQPLTKVDEYFTYCIAAPNLHKQLQEIIHHK